MRCVTDLSRQVKMTFTTSAKTKQETDKYSKVDFPSSADKCELGADSPNFVQDLIYNSTNFSFPLFKVLAMNTKTLSLNQNFGLQVRNDAIYLRLRDLYLGMCHILWLSSDIYTAQRYFYFLFLDLHLPQSKFQYKQVVGFHPCKIHDMCN